MERLLPRARRTSRKIRATPSKHGMPLQHSITCRANTLLFVGSSTIELRMFRTSRGPEELHRRPARQRLLSKIFADHLAPSFQDSHRTLRKLRTGSTCPYS